MKCFKSTVLVVLFLLVLTLFVSCSSSSSDDEDGEDLGTDTEETADGVTDDDATELTDGIAWSTGYPKISNVGETEFTVLVSLTVPATVNIKVQLAGDDAPTVEELAAGTGDSQKVYATEAGKEFSATFTDMVSATDYKVYLIAADDANGDVTAIKTLDVTTLEGTGPQAPKWDSEYPKVTDVTATSLKVLAQLDMPSTVYVQVFLATDPEPTEAEMTTGDTYHIIDVEQADTEYGLTVDELTADTEYTVYLIAYDTENDMKTVIKSVDVKTEAGTTIKLVGEIGFAQAAHGANIAVDSGGVPYVAFTVDKVTTAENAVWTFDGTDWVAYGTLGNVEFEDETPAIAIGGDDTVYVGYEYYDEIGSDPKHTKFVVYETTDGASWDLTGNSVIGNIDVIGHRDLAVTEDGTLLAAVLDGGDGYVYKLDNNAWASYNGYKLNSNTTILESIDLKVNGNDPYVAAATNDKMGALMAGETKWDWVAGTWANTSTQSPKYHDLDGNISVAADSAGSIYTAYIAYDDASYKIFVKKSENFGVDAWVTDELISPDTIGEDFEACDIIVSDDIAYLAFAADDHVYLMAYDETLGWINIGSLPVSGIRVVKLAAGLNGSVYGVFVQGIDEWTDPAPVGVFEYAPE